LPLTVASIEFNHFYCRKVTLTPSSNQYQITLHYEEQHPYDGTTISLDIDQSLWIHLHEIVYNVYTTNARLLIVCVLSVFPPFFVIRQDAQPLRGTPPGLLSKIAPL
jgi:hypothetical protein